MIYEVVVVEEAFAKMEEKEKARGPGAGNEGQ